MSLWFGRVGKLFAFVVAATAQVPLDMVAVPGGEFTFRQVNRWRESFGEIGFRETIRRRDGPFEDYGERAR